SSGPGSCCCRRVCLPAIVLAASCSRSAKASSWGDRSRGGSSSGAISASSRAQSFSRRFPVTSGSSFDPFRPSGLTARICSPAAGRRRGGRPRGAGDCPGPEPQQLAPRSIDRLLDLLGGGLVLAGPDRARRERLERGARVLRGLHRRFPRQLLAPAAPVEE